MIHINLHGPLSFLLVRHEKFLAGNDNLHEILNNIDSIVIFNIIPYLNKLFQTSKPEVF